MCFIKHIQLYFKCLPSKLLNALALNLDTTFEGIEPLQTVYIISQNQKCYFGGLYGSDTRMPCHEIQDSIK